MKLKLVRKIHRIEKVGMESSAWATQTFRNIQLGVDISLEWDANRGRPAWSKALNLGVTAGDPAANPGENMFEGGMDVDLAPWPRCIRVFKWRLRHVVAQRITLLKQLRIVKVLVAFSIVAI